MITSSIQLEKGQFLSDVMQELPDNTILNKTIPGIGATTLELSCPRDSIIIVPNVPVIISKTKKFPNLLGIYEDVYDADVEDYLIKNQGVHKLMTTPESFGKIKRACTNLDIDIYEEFFCLIDECHQLVKDVDYREDIVSPMTDFFLFKNKALVSATPIQFSDPRFCQQRFREIKVEAAYDYRQPINLIHTNNVEQMLKAYLQDHQGPFCLFMNSIDFVYAFITKMGIADDTAVFCACKSVTKLTTEYKFRNAYDEWLPERMKKYNFFTARFFTAFDLELDYQPDVVLLTDSIRTPHTIFDPATDSIQVFGRFRNGVQSITHIFNTDISIPVKTAEIVATEIFAHEHAYETIRTFYKQARDIHSRDAFREALESLPYNKWTYPDGSKNYFAIDNEINEVLVRGLYYKDSFLQSAYNASDFFVATASSHVCKEDDALRVKLQRSKSQVEKRRIMVETMSTFSQPYDEYEQNLVNEIRETDPLIVEAYELLGIEELERLKYSAKKMREAIIIKKKRSTAVVELIKNEFVVGRNYLNTDIVRKIKHVYDALGIKLEKELQGKEIMQFFQVSAYKGKKGRGYHIVQPII